MKRCFTCPRVFSVLLAVIFVQTFGFGQNPIINAGGQTYVGNGNAVFNDDVYSANIEDCSSIVFIVDFAFGGSQGTGWAGTGNLEYAGDGTSGCGGCVADPFNSMTTNCEMCWDFLYAQFSVDGIVEFTEMIGDAATDPINGTITFGPYCVSNQTTAEIRLLSQVIAGAEEITISSVRLECYEAVPDILFSGPVCSTDPLMLDAGIVPSSNASSYLWSTLGTGIFTTTTTPSVTINNMSDGDVISVDVTDVNGCPASDDVTITVTPATTPTFSLPTPCESDAPFALPTSSNEGINGTWTIGTTFDPAGLGGSSFPLTFIPNAGQCADQATESITVSSAASTTVMDALLCDNALPLDLSALTPVSFPGGTWSGTGVNSANGTFDPTGLGTGTYTVFYDPNQSCRTSGSGVITVTASTPVSLLPESICQDESPIALSTLVSGGPYPNGTWSGTGVNSFSGTFDPAGLDGPINLTFEPNEPCEGSNTTIITVRPAALVPLDADQICASSGLFDLSALLLTGPFPNGVWSGIGVTGGTQFDPLGLSGPQTLTFTPNEACSAANTTVLTITPATVLTGTDLSLCANGPTVNLDDQLSTPNEPGSWSGGPGISGASNLDPTGLTGTIAYTFTPDDPCVTGPTILISFSSPQTVSFTQDTIVLCPTDPSFNLNLALTSVSFTGVWSGAQVGSQLFNPAGLNGLYSATFTPNDTCSMPNTLYLQVSAAQSVAPQDTSLCSNNGVFNLNTLLPTGAPSGSWSGTGVSGSSFNPLVITTPNTATVEFTPTSSCATASQATITVTPAVSLLPRDTSLCNESGLSYDLNASVAPMGIAGTWSGPQLTGSIFTSSATTVGLFTFTFEPDGACVDTIQLDIQVNTPLSLSLNDATICQLDGPLTLNSLFPGVLPVGTWMSSTGAITGNQFDPNVSGAGTFTVEFIPGSGGCITSSFAEITVTNGGKANIADRTICVTGSLIDLTNYEDPSFPGGTWSADNGVLPGTNELNPILLPGGFTNVYYSPPGNCVVGDTAVFTIAAGIDPNLAVTNLCSNGAPFDLNAIVQNPSAIGTWQQEPYVTGSLFDPTMVAAGDVTVIFLGDSVSCTINDTTTIVLAPFLDPNLVDQDLCESGGLFDLTGLLPSGVTGGSWLTIAGAPISSDFDPTGLSGPVEIIYNPDRACAIPDTVTLTIGATASVNLRTDTVCVDEIPFNANSLIAGATIAGSWSGSGITDSIFRAPVPGDYPLTFTPDSSNPCATASMTVLTVQATTDPDLALLSICSGDSPFDLNGLVQNATATGDWSWAAGSGSMFDPSTLPAGAYTFYFDGVGSTCGRDSTVVTVIDEQSPNLADLNLCTSGLPINLNTLVLGAIDTNLVSWNLLGGGFVSPIFDPSIGDGVYGLVLTTSQNCVAEDTITVTVSGSVTPTVLGDTLCTNPSAIDLSAYGDPAFPNGTWFGTNVSGSTLTTTGAGTYAVVFDPQDPCGISVTANFEVVEAPSLSILSVDCVPGQPFYTVQLSVSTSVNGGSVMINGQPTSGAVFISGQIPSGVDTSFTITDRFACGPIPLVVPAPTCTVAACTTEPGTMFIGQNDTLSLCTDASLDATVYFQNDTTLTANDSFGYLVHSNPSATLGTLFSTTIGSSEIDLSGLPVNTVLYLSPAAGPALPNGLFDTTDSCFSISAGVPFVIIDPTLAFVGGDTSVCSGQTATILFQLTGADVAFLDLQLFRNGVPQGVFPSGASGAVDTFRTTTSLAGNYELNFFNILGDGCAIPPIQFEFTVVDTLRETFTASICGRDSFVFGGQTFNATNPTGTVNLIASTGCDSLLTVNLTPLPTVYEQLVGTFCQGDTIRVGDSVFVNSVTDTVLFAFPSFDGCDTGVIVNFGFTNFTTGQLDTVLCAGSSLTIGTRTFDATNPSDTVQLSSISGCDSILTVNVTFSDPIGSLDGQFCVSDTLSVGNERFFAGNSTGQVILPTASYLGCDSTVNVALNFVNTVREVIRPQLCEDDDFTQAGLTVNSTNPLDSAVFAGGSINGCDSVFILDAILLSPSINAIRSILCEGDSITIADSLFTFLEPMGTITLPTANWQGCDSIIEIDLQVLPLSTDTVRQTLAANDSLVIGGQVFDIGNASGVVTLTGNSGCDSIVVVELVFQQNTVVATGFAPTCADGDDGFIVVSSIENGVAPYQVSITGAGSFVLPILPDTLFGLSPNAGYDLQITDANMRMLTVEVEVPNAQNLAVSIGRDTTISLGETLILKPVFNFPATSWTWNPTEFLDDASLLNPTISPLQNTIIQFSISDSLGCTATDELVIGVTRTSNVFIPNVFSPNGDGNNDVFFIFAGADVVEIRQLLIFDRWGGLVFENGSFAPNESSGGWDGFHNGQPVNLGVYVFMAEIEFLDGTTELYSGDLTVVR